MGNFGIKDSANIYLKNLETREVIYIPFLNKFGIELKSGGEVFALKRGAKALKWEKALEGSFNGELEIINTQILALMLGANLVTADTEIFKREKLKVATNKITLSQVPVANSLTVATIDSDEVVNIKEYVVVTGTPTTGQCKITSKDVTFFAGDLADNTVVSATYLLHNANGKKIEVKSNAKMPSFALWADVSISLEDGSGEEFKQIYLPKISLKRDVKFDFDSENSSKFNLDGTLLADKDDNMLIWTEE